MPNPISDLRLMLELYAAYLDKEENRDTRNLQEGPNAVNETRAALRALVKLNDKPDELKPKLLPFLRRFQEQQGLSKVEKPEQGFDEHSNTHQQLAERTKSLLAWHILRHTPSSINFSALEYLATRLTIKAMRQGNLPQSLYNDTLNDQMGFIAADLIETGQKHGLKAMEARAEEVVAAGGITLEKNYGALDQKEVLKLFGTPENPTRPPISILGYLSLGPNMSNGQIALPDVAHHAQFHEGHYTLTPEQIQEYNRALPGALPNLNAPAGGKENPVERAQKTLPGQAKLDSMLANKTLPKGMTVDATLLKSLLGKATHDLNANLLGHAVGMMGGAKDPLIGPAMVLDGNPADFSETDKSKLMATLDALGGRKGSGRYEGNGKIRSEDIQYAQEHLEEFKQLLGKVGEANPATIMPKKTGPRQK